MTPILDVEGLQIDRMRSGRAEPIVKTIDLSLRVGETIGIVGESGSGKSMTARAMVGLLPPTLVAHGVIKYGDRNLLTLGESEWRSIRGREIGLVLQDPFTILNPVLRCGRILTESFRRRSHGRHQRRERRAEAIGRLREVGIRDERVVDRYPFQLSGGMRQRVAIAAALARDPRILIADEPSTALDVTTQREILALLKGLQTSRGMGLVLITHDLRVAFAMCDRIYVLYAGSLVEVASAGELEAEPLHPYSQGLLLSEPPPDYRVAHLTAIPGTVPDPTEVAGCCPFAPRCQWAGAVCLEGTPPLRELAPGRLTACIRLEEIRIEMSTLRQQLEHASPAAAQRSSKPLVEVRDVYKIFGSGTNAVRALDGVSVEVGENESIGIVGESGSGKTTLARMLVGLERPTHGDIVIDGVYASDWGTLSRRDRRRLRRTVQIVFQDPYSSLNPMRTVGWTLSEAVRTHDANTRDVVTRVNELLVSVGLKPEHSQRKPVALSGGERQRVAIARALAVRPRVLVCDEPVSALDMSVQAQILNLLGSLRREQGIGYVFITHDLAIVRQVAEHVYVMHGGRIVESGHVDDVLTHPRDPYTVKLLESVPRSDADWLTGA